MPFEAKSFALGCRVEHRQEIINLAQWGREKLPGVKAAEYRLTFKEEGRLPVYTFCMCPGGTVVPATAYRGANIVNGKSDYKRDALFANAAVVVGIRPDELMDIPEGQKGALEILDWLRRLEESFYTYAGGYRGPACRVGDFLKGEVSADFPGSSYPFGLVPVDFRELLPEIIHKSMERGVKNFCKRIKGFEDGVLMGLESKTSAPVRALRESSGKSVRFENLYISGEGSGYSGGIVSSAADGIKAAVDIIKEVPRHFSSF
ncbi:MAG: hypothetical protein GY757_30220 [bacterium]|nr:hypothetical protein [bacterium]